MNGVEEAAGQGAAVSSIQVTTFARIRMIETGYYEMQVGSIERVMLDSGAAVSVCSLGFAPEVQLASRSRNATLRSASGAPIKQDRRRSTLTARLAATQAIQETSATPCSSQVACTWGKPGLPTPKRSTERGSGCISAWPLSSQYFFFLSILHVEKIRVKGAVAR